jgi:UTP--glucose-1-phosphate uridylyltransferase
VAQRAQPPPIRKAVFPAAGLGTRFLPATKAQPKEMLPIVDKPTIQYGVEEAVASGIREIILVTGRGKNAIEDHFDRAVELEIFLERKGGKSEALDELRRISDLAPVIYIRQKEPLGLGHAILTAREAVGEAPFAVVLGDDVIVAPVPCLAQLLEVYARTGAPVVAVQRVPREAISSYGILAADPAGDGVWRIRDMVEKPDPATAPSDLAIIGRYLLTPNIFPALEGVAPGAGGEIQLTDGLRALLRAGPMYGVEFVGRRYDAGSKLGFLQATVEFALRRPDLAEPFRAYLKSLDLDGAGSAPDPPDTSRRHAAAGTRPATREEPPS